MNRTVKMLSGVNVYLLEPNIECMDEFLTKVENSQDLHYPWVYPPSNENMYYEYINRFQSDNQKGFFIRLNRSGSLIGVININEIVRGCFQSGHLGFYAFSGNEGKGLMSEGLELVISYAFKELKLHRLEANIQTTNIKSIAFIKRRHFRHEGMSPNYLKINNEWRDHERFAITAEEYKEKNHIYSILT